MTNGDKERHQLLCPNYRQLMEVPGVLGLSEKCKRVRNSSSGSRYPCYIVIIQISLTNIN